MDERDKLIIKKALLVTFSLVFVFLIIAYIVLYFTSWTLNSISVAVLPEIIYSVFVIFIFICSITVLIQYGWGGKEKENE